MIALDASALLAFLFREDGHERVAAAIGASCLSTVNLTEVLGRFVRDGHDEIDRWLIRVRLLGRLDARRIGDHNGGRARGGRRRQVVDEATEGGPE